MLEKCVKEVHDLLGVTPQDLQTLKHVRLVWQKLDTLRKQAEKDPTKLSQYKAALEPALKQARSMQTIEDPAVLALEVKEMLDWYTAEAEKYGVYERERWRIPHDHQEWCQKWCQPQWLAFLVAWNKLVETGTRQAIADVKTSATELFKAYVASPQSR